jgi:hypothetical protein
MFFTISLPVLIVISLAGATAFFGWFFYARMSHWLVRGSEIGENLKIQKREGGNLPDCFDKQFDDVILLLNSSLSTAEKESASEDQTPDNTIETSNFNDFENFAEQKIDLFLKRLEFYDQKASLITERNNLVEGSDSTEYQEIDQKIKQIDIKIKEIDSTLKGLGIPRISIPEFLRINHQMDLIQKRIYTHYNVVRLYYATSTTLAILASISLLGGSVLLFVVTKDGWNEVSKNQKHLVVSLFVFAGFYVFCLNLPAVLSAERIYESNLAQYIGYTNLEGEICTVLATERFFGTPENPEVITEVEFNRLIHSVEREMRRLNTHNLSPNLAAIEGFTFTLDSLDIPRKPDEPVD